MNRIYSFPRGWPGRILSAAMYASLMVAFTGGTIAMLSYCLPGYVEGFATLKYSRTPATVVASQIVRSTGTHRGGTSTQEVSVTYSYEVGGTPYTSSHAAAGGLMVWGMYAANRLLAQFKPGQRIWAYYDPNDPGHAVVSPGVQLFPYAASLFVHPFAALSAFILSGFPAAMRAALNPRAAAGLHIKEEGARTIVQLTPGLPMDQRRLTLAFAFLAVPIAAAGVGTVATMFMEFPRADAYPAAVFALVMLVEVALILLNKRLSANEALCLVIDRARGVVRLPVAFGRSGPVDLPISTVDSVVRVEREFQGQYSWFQRQSGPYVGTNHDVDIETHGAAGHGFTIGRWQSEPQEAEDVAAWLRERLAIGPRQPGSAAPRDPRASAAG